MLSVPVNMFKAKILNYLSNQGENEKHFILVIALLPITIR